MTQEAPLSESLTRSFALGTYGLAVQGGARFAFTIVVGRELGVQALGTVTTLLAIGVFASLLWPTSAGFAASLELARARRTNTRADMSALNRQVQVSLVLIGASTALLGAAISRDIGLTVGGALASVGYAAYVYARGAQLGMGELSRVAVWDTVCGAVLLGGALLLIGDAPHLVLLSLAAGYGLFAVRCWPRTGTGTTTGTAEAAGRDRATERFVGGNVIAQVTGGGIVNLTMLGAHVFGTPLATGVFAAAFALATPALMLGQSLQQVLIPHFGRDHDALERRRDVLRVLARLGSVLAAVFALVIIAAPLLLDVLFGPDYAGAVAELRWLLMCVLFASLALIPAAALIAAARTRELVAASVLGFCIGVAAIIGLGPLISTWSSVVGYGVSSALTGALCYRALWKR